MFNYKAEDLFQRLFTLLMNPVESGNKIEALNVTEKPANIGCLYTYPNGRHCIIGSVLDEAHAQNLVNSGHPNSLPVKEILAGKIDDDAALHYLKNIQAAHDMLATGKSAAGELRGDMCEAIGQYSATKRYILLGVVHEQYAKYRTFKAESALDEATDVVA